MSIINIFKIPFSYIIIRHPYKDSLDKITYIFFPIIFGLFIYFFPTFNLFHNDGIISSINSFMGTLSGFFVTALAAIATFQGGPYNVDKPFSDKAATLRSIPLTRRQFLCYLFGYLSASSIIISLIGISISAYLTTTLNLSYKFAHYVGIIKTIFFTSYMTAFSHVIVTTFLGLVFLTDRLTHSSNDTKHDIE